jgi:hypothetical protein
VTIKIVEESVASFSDHLAIPISFNVDSIFDVIPAGETFVLNERKLACSYAKDYDAIENPLEWTRFDTSKWGLIAGYVQGKRVGGWSSPLTRLELTTRSFGPVESPSVAGPSRTRNRKGVVSGSRSLGTSTWLHGTEG